MAQFAQRDSALSAQPPRSPAVRRDSVSAAEFRGALSQFTTAVSVIATDGAAGSAGLTCSAVCAVSDEPPSLLVCVHGKSAANRVIKANGVFCVNCLQAEQKDVSQVFAGVGNMPMQERFTTAAWGALATGAPYCKDALVALDCEVTDVRDVGTHTIFIGTVVATAEGRAGEPLVYQRRAYATTRLL